MMHNGVWKGKRIFSSEYINKALSPSQTNQNYGYLWWLNTDKKMIEVPQSVFYANGFGGNYIVVDREHDIVIVTRWLDQNYLDDIIALTIKAIK
jgi:CubicO group peptidase (beta-lactamase class C family)